MLKRDAELTLRNLSRQFKAVAVVGPRQSGKTTLTRHVFRDKPYVNLENPDIRRFALEDPRGFLSQYKTGAVFDEIQRVPDIFSYLEQILDEEKEKGKYILTGSNNFLLQENISQSLARRIAYINLLPFTITELPEKESTNLNTLIFKGFYPPIYDQNIKPEIWFPNYLRTYIERDVRQIKNISDLNVFEKFLKLSAGRIGQLLNMNSLSIETGVDIKTISSWLGILESSFIVYRLFPHHKNYNKRLVKMPKLFFYDSGLVCALLGIQNAQQLNFHPLYGSIFENFVIGELIKHRLNKANTNYFYFWRNNTGHEIDILTEEKNKLHPIEIKSGKTVTKEFYKGLKYWFKISGESRGTIIYGRDTNQKHSNGVDILSWKHIHQLNI
jgi:predicted AAA+ superfamily ATPase